MKEFIQSLLESSIKWLVSALMVVGGAYFAVEAWVDKKVFAAEGRVMLIRSVDMAHLDKRFDTIEALILKIDRN